MDYSPETFSEELISAYLDGELTAEEQASVEQTLAANAEFRQLADELRMLREGLQSLPRHQLPSDFSDQILGRLTASPKPPGTSLDNARRQRPRRDLLMTIGALAAVAAGILIACLSFSGFWEGDTIVARNDDRGSRATEDLPIPRDETVEAIVEPESAPTFSRSRMDSPAVDPGLDYVVHVDIPEDAGGWHDFDESLQQHDVVLEKTPKQNANYDEMVREIRELVQPDLSDAEISSSAGSQVKSARMFYVEAKRQQIDAIRAQFSHQQYSVAAARVPGRSQRSMSPPMAGAESQLAGSDNGAASLSTGAGPTFVDDLKKNVGEVRKLAVADQPADHPAFAFRLDPSHRSVERQTSESPSTDVGPICHFRAERDDEQPATAGCNAGSWSKWNGGKSSGFERRSNGSRVVSLGTSDSPVFDGTASPDSCPAECR